MGISLATKRQREVGTRVRDLRLGKKIRQVDLAAAAGLSWRHLIRIEQGEGGKARPETLDRLAEALGVTRDKLTGSDDEEESRAMTASEALSYAFRLIAREEIKAAKVG